MRRKYPKSTDTRGSSSCCTPVTNSQFHGVTPQPCSTAGSVIELGATVLPKAAVAHAEHSPLPNGFSRLQSGKLLRFRSVTVIVVLVAIALAGLCAVAVCEPSCVTPRVALNFNA